MAATIAAELIRDTAMRRK